MMTRLPAIVQAIRACFLTIALFAFTLIASSGVAGAADATIGAASPSRSFPSNSKLSRRACRI